MIIILKLVGASLIGMFVSILQKNIAMGKKSADGNIIYPGLWVFIKNDVRALSMGLVAILLMFLFFGSAIDSSRVVGPEDVYTLPFLDWEIHRHFIWDALLVVAFSTIGYSGIAIPLTLWGKTNKLINLGIKNKTPEPAQEAPTLMPTELPKK